MQRSIVSVIVLGLGLGACQAGDPPSEPPTGKVEQAFGEPQNGFPAWYERMIHVMVNRARAAPLTDLGACPGCADVHNASCHAYDDPRPPLQWYYDMNRSARFHALNLTSSGCGMQHNSPCLLVGNISSIYPVPCNGDTSCACQGGTVACASGTSWDARLGLFGISGSYRGENIAGFGDPKGIFYQWLLEATNDPTCGYSGGNGHRWNILSVDYVRLGVGASPNYTVQDFWGAGSITQKIGAGAHYPQTGSNLEMRANWYSATSAQGAYVDIDGTCHAMSIERGSATNGTYLYNASVGNGCHQYYFIFVDSAAQTYTYPDTGSFGESCAQDWSASRPALGNGCPNGASCGNGVIDPGETCDPPASCPASCNDGNSCTVDTMTGSAAACNVACSYTNITACTNADGCCPSGCNANNDSDCSASCGNGVVEPGETCDPPASCPPSCDDGNSCTADAMTGSAANCNVACSHSAITACSGGDGCCPSGCNANSDNDCSASCNNGVVEPGETCDPPATCPSSCDDGNTCTNDAMTGSAANCNVACSHTPIVSCAGGDGCCPAGCDANGDSDCSASCGNGVVEPGETCNPPASCPASCDDGNSCTNDAMTGSAANCNAACSHTNIVSCVDGDGCCPSGCDGNSDTDCSQSCGNGVVEPGETCDPPASCPQSCDDGNSCTNDSMTGSAANCNAACSHTPIVTCLGGDGCCPAGCDANGDSDCSQSCGNGAIEPGETCDPPSSCPSSCDDGNGCTNDAMTGSAANCNAACAHTPIVSCANGDGCCPAGCSPAGDDDCSQSCGNGVVNPGETCDPQASCPTSCDDGLGCTVDTMTGSAANCNAACSSTAIVSCVSGDGCCPPGCDVSSDSDCICGNGVLDQGETCDPPSSCPQSCDDGDPCTVDTLTGSPDSCNVGCQHVPITQCAAGDGCCSSECSDADDADCPAGASEEDSGCGCATVGAPARTRGWLLLLLGLPVLVARRRVNSGAASVAGRAG